MEWRDEGIVLGLRRHGESAAIVTLLTRAHGRHGGLVRGARAARLRGVLQPGNRVATDWRARLEEHLGTMTVELVQAHAAPLLTDPGRLSALSAATALIEVGLPEREPHPVLFDNLDALLIALEGDGWAETYSRWEIGLLGELGFGLDLSACAATGVTEDLAYVSPKTGRAVSTEAGAPYQDKLFTLPGYLRHPLGQGGAETEDILGALAISGHFLARHVFSPIGKPLPDPRTRLVELLKRQQSGG